MSISARSPIFWERLGKTAEINLAGSGTWSPRQRSILGLKRMMEGAPAPAGSEHLPRCNSEVVVAETVTVGPVGRDVRHWKCLEFGRISVVNCCSRSLEEPKNSFYFFLSQYWFISFLYVINFLQSEVRQTWVNFNCVEKCLIVLLLRTLWNSDRWLYRQYTYLLCLSSKLQIYIGSGWLANPFRNVADWVNRWTGLWMNFVQTSAE